MSKKVIFISGPYRSESEWGLEENIRHAQSASIKLWKDGWVVICPHLNTAHFGGVCPDSVWLEGDLEILKRCDAIYMLNTAHHSVGAQAELMAALTWGKEVIYEGKE